MVCHITMSLRWDYLEMTSSLSGEENIGILLVSLLAPCLPSLPTKI